MRLVSEVRFGTCLFDLVGVSLAVFLNHQHLTQGHTSSVCFRVFQRQTVYVHNRYLALVPKFLGGFERFVLAVLVRAVQHSQRTDSLSQHHYVFFAL